MFKLMIDCGHGIYTPGKQTLNGNKGIIKEFTLNYNVYLQLKELLKDYDVELKTCFDTSGKTDTSLAERVRISNNYKPDLFISIHHNAFQNKWGTHTGVEVHLADNSSSTSKNVAKILLPLLSKNTGLKQRNINYTNFYVVRNLKHPSLLVEGGFMDSNIDYPIITGSTGQYGYAKAILDMLISCYKITKKVSKPTTPTTTGTFFRVIADSYTIKQNAINRQNQLKSLGFDSFLVAVQKDGKTFFRVVVGSYQNRKNAEEQQAKLKKHNINSFLEAFKK